MLLVYYNAFWSEDCIGDFSHIVITTFKEFIQKFLEVHFDDWMVFGLIKCNVASLCLMLDTCRKYHITLKLKK